MRPLYSLWYPSAESLVPELFSRSYNDIIPPSHLMTPCRLFCWKPFPPNQRTLFPCHSPSVVLLSLICPKNSPLSCFCCLSAPSLCPPLFLISCEYPSLLSLFLFQMFSFLFSLSISINFLPIWLFFPLLLLLLVSLPSLDLITPNCCITIHHMAVYLIMS